MGNPVVFTIHGIGRQEKGYSDPLKKLVNKRGVTPDWIEGDWQHITQPDQDLLRTKFGWNNGMREPLLSFAGDAISYSGPKGVKIRDCIWEGILQSANSVSDCDFVIVAHSLGAPIISDTIWDRVVRGNQLPPNVKRWRLITVGAAITLYSQRWLLEEFTKPIRPDTWINIRHQDDPISLPLKSLNSEYDQAVTEEIVLPRGIVSGGFSWLPFGSGAWARDIVGIAAHSGYWSNSVVADKLVKLLQS